MSKIICKICGAEEESNRWIPETKEEVEKKKSRCVLVAFIGQGNIA